jgi:hypothetical protein
LIFKKAFIHGDKKGGKVGAVRVTYPDNPLLATHGEGEDD